MKPGYLLFAAAATLASVACNSEQNGNNVTTGNATPAEAVEPPADGDWTKVVRQTAAGGFRMGNPNAPVQLVEFGSMTCPHCAEFDDTGVKPLVNDYVKSGRVSFEFRNFVRDPLDMTLALVARCGGADSFFPLTDAMFDTQEQFFERAQAAPVEQQQAIQQLPPGQQFQGYAKLIGLQQWAAQRGIPSARQQQCLTNQQEIDRLVQMTSDASNEYDVPGTPSFLINGKLVENVSSWSTLEPKIREALGS